MSKDVLFFLQTTPFKLYYYFCMMNKVRFWSKTVSDILDGLMLSFDNPLDPHAKTLSTPAVVVKRL